MQRHLKSSLDLNPALNLEWKDFIPNAKQIADASFWLRFKDSKNMIHYSPFEMASYTIMQKNYLSKELIYDTHVLLRAWSNNFEYCDGFLLDLGWHELEYALVPFAGVIQGWTILEFEMTPIGNITIFVIMRQNVGNINILVMLMMLMNQSLFYCGQMINRPTITS